MKIKTKLVLIITAVNVACIGVLTIASLRFTQQQITLLADENVRGVAQNSANRIGGWLENYLNKVQALGQIVSHYDTMKPEERRPVINSMLHSLAEENPDLLNVWAIFEPNALDGMDDYFINSPGTDATGRFISRYVRENDAITLNAHTGYTNEGSGGNYYFQSFRSGKEAIIEPYYLSVGGKNKLVTSLTVPLIRSGETIGVAGVDIELTEVQELAGTIRPFGIGDSAVFSHGGIVIAHPDPGRFGKHMKDTEHDLVGIHLGEMVQAVRDGAEAHFKNYWPAIKSDMLIALSPFTVGDSDTPWAFAVAAPERIIMAPVYRMVFISIILGAAILGVLTLIVLVVSKSITSPLKSMEAAFAAIGEGDFTHGLEVRSNDEIGNIGRSFNITLEKMKTLIITIKKQAAALFDIGNALASNMNQTAAAVNQITANIKSIKSQVASQSSSVTETNATMEQITGTINRLSDHIDHQSVSVSSSSSAVEQMLANIQSVTDTLVRNAENAYSLSIASEDGRASLQEVAQDIREIAHESEGLLEINKLMKNIAGQTNLLSMNAAIEAAHAGDAGSGFAVVSGEIRKLAENSGEQSKTIGSVLRKIIASIEKIDRSTGIVLGKFEVIDTGVKTVTNQEANIREAMEEQGVGSHQILETISQLKDITHHVKDGSRKMLSDSWEVIEEGKRLEQVTQEITGGMNEMADGADKRNAARNQVNEISGKNKESIDILVREVSRFKV